jgi:electron transport complex protein RnfB
MNASAALVDRIDEQLPQTQCRRCGYDGCRPYAEAIAADEADINRCPPGGTATLLTLARLLGRPAPPLDTMRGQPGPLRVACIDESACVGCTLCIAACPVDAIIGAEKRMHAVLTSLCSGCELCVAPCPVDCIAMRPAQREWTASDAIAARARFEQRQARRMAGAAAKRDAETRKRKAAVAAAIERARARRAALTQ